MAKPIGPTIPRWQLGEELARLRKKADYTRQRIADRLRCSVSKIEKIEGGQVRSKLAELETMLTEYGVPQDEWPPLLELQRLGATRGWWSKFGRLPQPFTEFLGLEMAAVTIRTFELAVIPGLFQTEDYARALTQSDTVGMTPEWLEREVGLRINRQKQILAEDPPEIFLVLDEAALRRQIGDPKIMHDQLQHLIELSRSIHLQVAPLEQGGHPGVHGSFVIFDFPEELHSPVVYVECPAGNLYLEKTIDLRRCSLAFDHLLGAALSRPKSVALIKDMIRQLE